MDHTDMSCHYTHLVLAFILSETIACDSHRDAPSALSALGIVLQTTTPLPQVWLRKESVDMRRPARQQEEVIMRCDAVGRWDGGCRMQVSAAGLGLFG